jgi:hypothetical protein
MLDLLIKDCIDNIKSHLSYIDILCYKLTNKSNHHKMILPNFSDVFIKRLLQHHIVPSYEDAKLFCNNLYNTGAYVAGSFVLDCLYNTNYHQDIDIYDQTNSVDYHRSKTYVHNSMFKFGDDKMRFTQSLYSSGFVYVDDENEDPSLVIRCFLHKSYPGLKHKRITVGNDSKYITPKTNDCIQIIPIGLTLKNNERSVIPRFISASFDLEICQSIFDGHDIHIKNINKIINKYDFIKPNTRFMLSMYPDESYINYENYEKDECILTQIRMDKYIERGFDIKYHPQYEEIDNFIKETLKSKKYVKGMSHYNIKYIESGEIDLSKYDS